MPWLFTYWGGTSRPELTNHLSSISTSFADGLTHNRVILIEPSMAYFQLSPLSGAERVEAEAFSRCPTVFSVGILPD